MSHKTIVVGISGASGSPYAVNTLKTLLELGHTVHAIFSPVSKLVWLHENGTHLNDFLNEMHALYPNKLHIENNLDLGGKPASGSFRHVGMIVIPCSMKCLAAIANGFASNLIERAADVALKERFPLVLAARETPLNLIHLENMKKITLAGGIILPTSPGFYHQPKSVDDLVNFVVGKALDLLGIQNHQLFTRWKEKETDND